MAEEKNRLLNFGVLFRISVIMMHEMKIVNAFLSLPLIFGYMWFPHSSEIVRQFLF
jgi:hypothetical protein